MFDHIAKRPDGYIAISYEDGHVVERDTLQCVHCGAHFIVEPGSGRRRGFCLKCGGPTCGRPGCDSCTPFEKKLEALEEGARCH